MLALLLRRPRRPLCVYTACLHMCGDRRRKCLVPGAGTGGPAVAAALRRLLFVYTAGVGVRVRLVGGVALRPLLCVYMARACTWGGRRECLVREVAEAEKEEAVGGWREVAWGWPA